MEELLYCALLASGNDACNAIAVHVAGSVSAFVERMNQLAAELGCTGSHFVNAHGAPNDGHYTTARDMALIAQAAYRRRSSSPSAAHRSTPSPPPTSAKPGISPTPTPSSQRMAFTGTSTSTPTALPAKPATRTRQLLPGLFRHPGRTWTLSAW